MSARQEIIHAADDFEVSCELFLDSVGELFPAFIALLVAAEIAPSLRPSELLEAARRLNPEQLETLKQRGEELQEFGRDFKKSSERLAGVIRRFVPHLPEDI